MYLVPKHYITACEVEITSHFMHEEMEDLRGSMTYLTKVP